MGCISSKAQKEHVSQPIEKDISKSNQGSLHTIHPEEKKSEGPLEVVNNAETKEDNQLGNSRLSTQKRSLSKTLSAKISLTAPSEDACCYFFGVDFENNKKSFKFNPKTETFNQFETPATLEVFNMSACVYISEYLIYLTGGTDSEANKITNKVFKYNPTSNTAEELPPFSIERYAHQATFFQDQLYVIGGLGYEKATADGGEDQENVLKSVEKYDVKTKKWTKACDLNHGRSLAQALVYQNQIFVLGGYIGNTKRTCTIEKLNPQSNKWELIDFKLPSSLEASFMFSPGANLIHIIGGRNSLGDVNTNYVYNLKDNTYKVMKAMNHERVLHKGFLYKEKLFVFGGDNDDTIEEYHILEDEWTKQPSSSRALLSGIKTFSASQPILYVEETSEPRFEEALSPTDKKSKKCHIFGDDEVSFILEVNFSKGFVKEKPVPGNLRLRGYQGIVALPNGSYFLCGGKDKANVKVSQKAYLYNSYLHVAKQVPNCNVARYTFNIIYMGEQIYIIGGRKWGEDDEAILSSCERYNLLTNQWEQIAKLNRPRCSAMAFQLKNRIYVLGGYKGDTHRWAEIEVYYPEKNCWDVWKTQLKVALEGSSIVVANRRGGIFLLGGRTDDGDTDKVWDFDVEQGDMWEVGNLKEAKSLNKVFEFNERKAFVLGGEKYMTEFFDLTESKPIAEDAFSTEINNQLRKIVSKGRSTENKVLRFGLA